MNLRIAALLAITLVAHGHMRSWAQGTFQLAVLKYNGGGDWYANPTAVPNLVKFCNINIATNISIVDIKLKQQLNATTIWIW